MDATTTYQKFAQFYDAYVQGFVEDLKLYTSLCQPDDRILEIGCGTGRVLKHFLERGFITEVNDALLGKYLDHEFPVMMSKSPPKVKWSARAVGFDNEYIIKYRLGKSEDEIKELYQCGALGKWADVRGRRPAADWDGKTGLIMAKG